MQNSLISARDRLVEFLLNFDNGTMRFPHYMTHIMILHILDRERSSVREQE